MKYNIYDAVDSAVFDFGAGEPEAVEPIRFSLRRALEAMETESDKPLSPEAIPQVAAASGDTLDGEFGLIVQSLLTGEPLDEAVDAPAPLPQAPQPGGHYRSKTVKDVDGRPAEEGISLDIFMGDDN